MPETAQPIRRSLNFQIPLAKHLTERRGDAFEWGMSDCVMFALDCLDLVLESPLVRPVLGYTDRAGALAAQNAHPFLESIAAQTRLKEINPAMRQTGDMAYCTHDDGLPSVFVIEGGNAWTVWCDDMPAPRVGYAGIQAIPARLLPWEKYRLFRVGSV
jgi:hypothetical protein